MKINQQISNRFEELASMASQIRMKHDQEYGDSIDDAEASRPGLLAHSTLLPRSSVRILLTTGICHCNMENITDVAQNFYP